MGSFSEATFLTPTNTCVSAIFLDGRDRSGDGGRWLKRHLDNVENYCFGVVCHFYFMYYDEYWKMANHFHIKYDHCIDFDHAFIASQFKASRSKFVFRSILFAYYSKKYQLNSENDHIAAHDVYKSLVCINTITL